jgi:hypothetical protein
VASTCSLAEATGLVVPIPTCAVDVKETNNIEISRLFFILMIINPVEIELLPELPLPGKVKKT